MNLNEVVQQLMQYMAGMIPGGNILNMFTPMLSNIVSPQSSMANRFVWGTDGVSPALSAMQYMNRTQQQIFNRPADDASEAMKMRSLMTYHQALNPGMSESELRVKAQKDMDNPFSVPAFIMDYMDPYDIKRGIAEAERLGSSLQRRNFTPMDIRGATFAAQVSEELFGKDGKSGLIKDVIDNPKAYSNLKLSEVMYLGQELTHSDPDGFKTSTGSFDSTKFRSSIKAVSRAIEPWKDIFGEDVPELLNKLEALTGQGIAMQKQSLRASGNHLAGVMQATGANIQHITGYRDALARQFATNPFENRTILGSHNIAADMVLGISNNGMNTMTNEEFQAVAGSFYKGTADSKLADRYALAFSAWSDNKGSEFKTMSNRYQEAFKQAKARGLEDKEAVKYAVRVSSRGNENFLAEYSANLARGDSHEEAAINAANTVDKAKFKTQYDQLLASDPNMTRDEALLKLSGTRSLQDLEKYRYTDRHIDMVKSGEGAQISREATISLIQQWVQKDYVSNTGKYRQHHNKAAEMLGKMSTREFTDFMAKSRDEKRKFIMDTWNIHDREMALTVVNDIESSIAAGARVATHGKQNTETARNIAVVARQERKQREHAEQYSRFLDAASKLSTTGGFRAVLESIRNNKGSVDANELIKQYTGGIDVLEAVVRSVYNPERATDYTDEELKEYTKAVHFAQNNYLELGKKGSAFNDVYKKLISNDPQAKKEALKDMAAMSSVGQQNIARMTDEEKTEFVKMVRERRVKNEPLSSDEIGKDAYLDITVGSAIKKMRKEGGHEVRYLDAFDKMLKNTTATSKEQLIKEAKNMARSDPSLKGTDGENFVKWVENVALNKAKIGDVDGTDPILKLANVLEGLVKSLNLWINKQGQGG